jgi:xanthine dehydrogenase small subunit
MPALIALGAELELRQGTRYRRIPLERLYLGYQKKDLRPGEFVVSVVVPPPKAGRMFASYKLAKRIDQDISAVCAGFAVEISGGRIVDARLAYGGMAPIPTRAASAERVLVGQVWNEAAIESAVAALPADFTPLTDSRASQAYRLKTAGNLLRRFYMQQTANPPTLRVTDPSAHVEFT